MTLPTPYIDAYAFDLVVLFILHWVKKIMGDYTLQALEEKELTKLLVLVSGQKKKIVV